MSCMSCLCLVYVLQQNKQNKKSFKKVIFLDGPAGLTSPPPPLNGLAISGGTFFAASLNNDCKYILPRLNESTFARMVD